ncbi:signal peptidase II [Candidatus Clostridium radicumherbarum]|uniref:Lipoprotein signal peptidase n=1 Tax=Candidatus Clostridium radicumherbarum TaxID=3381662 RepID=A0ABW8TVH5_9CLOT
MEILIIVVGLLLDRITKIWALKSLYVNGDVVIIKNIFAFSYLENRGAAFGIFQNKVQLLSIVTSIVVLAMIFYLVKYKPKSRFLRISMAMIITGAIGNLIDRFVYKFVVDFILVHYKTVYYFPTFNVADMFVVIGTCLLALSIIRDEV